MTHDFAALKTPPPLDHDLATPTEENSSSSSSSSFLPAIATALRVATLLAMGLFVFGNIATWAPLYELQLVNRMTKWWSGYPHGDVGGGHAGHAGSIMDTGVQRDIWHTGHTEMVRPTFLFLFCILPFFVGVLLIETLRFVAPARRATASFLWSTSKLLRRKPTLPLLGLSRLTLGEWLFGVLYVVGGNVLCFWFQWDRRIDAARTAKNLTTTKYWNIIGISNGYLCIYNMAFLLLPVTRQSVWMEFFNLSYANGVKLHRWMGFATVVTGVIHTLGYWVKWVRDGTWQKYQLPCFHCDITVDPAGYYPWFNTFGLISVVALVLMIPTSLPVVRRKLYEWFYISHWVLFLISFFFAILHWGQILWWILPAGLLFFVSRAASSWNGIAPVAVHSCTVVGDTAPGSGELVQLVVQRVAGANYDYAAGHFVYLNVPSLSKLQWHALTIASSPRTSATHFTLLIKPLGDWSQQLVAYAHECAAAHQKPVVFLDGFYGSSLAHYDEYPTVCLVGGGIGVTPLLAVLEDIAAQVAAHGGDWLAASQPRVVFALAFRELALLRAVAPVVLKLRELDPTGAFFQTTLASSQQPSDAALDAPYRSAQLPERKSSVKNAAEATRLFYAPLRSSTSLRVTLFVVLYAVGILAVAGIRWGNGAVQGDHRPELWPLQRSVEMLVFCATIAVAYAFIYYEYLTLPRVHARETRDVTEDAATTLEDVHAMRDLATRLGVVFGARPSMDNVLADALALHANSTHATTLHSQIGVIVSGPVPLKDAANAAVVTLGRAKFDVHEEEFEL